MSQRGKETATCLQAHCASFVEETAFSKFYRDSLYQVHQFRNDPYTIRRSRCWNASRTRIESRRASSVGFGRVVRSNARVCSYANSPNFRWQFRFWAQVIKLRCFGRWRLIGREIGHWKRLECAGHVQDGEGSREAMAVVLIAE